MIVRSVNILVRDAFGRTLLQFRDSSTSTFPLEWGFWGGAMSPSDTSPEHCAARELQEELELPASPADFSHIGTRTSARGEAWLMLYHPTVDWPDFCIREGAGAAFLWRAEMRRLQLSKPVFEHLGSNPELFGKAP